MLSTKGLRRVPGFSNDRMNMQIQEHLTLQQSEKSWARMPSSIRPLAISSQLLLNVRELHSQSGIEVTP
jgi:hypothetical protein